MGSLDLDDLQEKNDQRLRQLKSLAGRMFTTVEFSHIATNVIVERKENML